MLWIPAFWKRSISATYLTRVSDTSGFSVDFTSYNIGPASPDRRVFVVIHWCEGTIHRTISSVTIGGVSATVHIQEGHSGGSTGFGVGIASAIVPAGTSATISVTMSGSLALHTTLISISAITTIGLQLSSPFDTASDTTAVTSNNLSDTINVPAGGLVIAGFTSSTNAAIDAVTWSGVTEEYDVSQTTGSLNIRQSMAWSSGLSAETGRTISASPGSEANSGNAFVAVSWN